MAASRASAAVSARAPVRAAPAPVEKKRPLALIVGVLAALLALPLGVALGAAYINAFGPAPHGRPVPQWVMPGTVRATTNDGLPVKAKVALDVVNNGTRNDVQQRLQQVSLLLEVSVASLGRDELTGRQGIQALSDDMLDRVNDYLRDEGVNGIRSVAIQDLVVGSH